MVRHRTVSLIDLAPTALLPCAPWRLVGGLALALAGAACSPGDGSDDGATTEGTTTTPGAGSEGPASTASSSTGPSGETDAPADDSGGTSGGPGSGPGSDDGPGDDGGGLGPADFDEGELDPPSHGGTITFREIGAPGWYPSRRDPADGPCDAYEGNGCCLAQHDVAGDELTPWDEELALTLRGPMRIKQLAVYQPPAPGSDTWSLVSGWDDRAPASAFGVAFHGNETEAGFEGEIGTECLVDVTTADPFACGDGSVPYCPPSPDPQHYGWAGAKLFVLLASMPHTDDDQAGSPCSEGSDGNWWDAPWVGLSLGELVRAGAFSDCHCYSKNPEQWWLGDGCGQFNVFEVVNDNNEFRNLDVFSTNFFGYAGYVGEGPCGAQCDVSGLGDAVDLIDKGSGAEAAMGAEASPEQGPGAAFRRPTEGYRYFVILLDVASRRVQLGIVHPQEIPADIAPLLPSLPGSISQQTVAQALELRLPQ